MTALNERKRKRGRKRKFFFSPEWTANVCVKATLGVQDVKELVVCQVGLIPCHVCGRIVASLWERGQINRVNWTVCYSHTYVWIHWAPDNFLMASQLHNSFWLILQIVLYQKMQIFFVRLLDSGSMFLVALIDCHAYSTALLFLILINIDIKLLLTCINFNINV